MSEGPIERTKLNVTVQLHYYYPSDANIYLFMWHAFVISMSIITAHFSAAS